MQDCGVKARVMDLLACLFYHAQHTYHKHKNILTLGHTTLCKEIQNNCNEGYETWTIKIWFFFTMFKYVNMLHLPNCSMLYQ
jgi:hypothetical protein